MCKDKKGNLVTEGRMVLQRQAEHLDELLNGHGDEDGNKVDADGEGETEDTRESLDKKKEDGEYGTDRNFEKTNVQYLQKRK